MLRKWGSVVLAASLLASSSVALADNSEQGALPAGKAAGVHQAQEFWSNRKLLWIVGAGVVLGGVVLAASGNGSNNTTTTTTTRP